VSVIVNLSRRDFLRSVAGVGGLVLGARARVAAGAGAGRRAAAPAAAFRTGVFLALAPDGTVTIVAHRSEMGTGIRTALPMVVAEELGADWRRVKIEQATGDDRYGSQDTDGSRSVRDFYETMREAGAAARAMLEQAGAAAMQVAASGCEARDHAVHHAATGRSVGFGDLAARASRLPVPPRASLRFRDPATYRYVGRGVPIADRADILSGKAVYGMDVRLAGMKVAAIARPPVPGARARSYNARECRAVPGVERVVELPCARAPFGFGALGGIAVVAKDTWAALSGVRRLKVEWEAPQPGAPEGSAGASGADPGAVYDSTRFRAHLEATARSSGEVVRRKGDLEAAMARARTVHSADYYLPHLAHASLEPPVATATVSGGRCTVWAPTQNPQGARDQVARALGLAPARVTVHVTLLGGGFGRKSFPDFIVEAALLARAVRAPVQVVWTREDDLKHDYYHTVAALHLEAGLDERGRPIAWLQRSVFPPIASTFDARAVQPTDGELAMGFTDMPFDVPAIRCERGPARAPLRIGWLRSVAHVYHAFAIGSFAGELAAAARRDPLEYLLELIGPPRHVDLAAEGVRYDNSGAPLAKYPVDTGRLRRVVETAAASAGWGRALPKGRGIGIACHRSFASYVATVVEVEVARGGAVSLPRVDVAIDCGRAIHPDRVKAQMEGAVVFGTSLALFGEITVRGGAVEQANFNDYRVARICDAPRAIHVAVVDAGDAPPGGVGEPGVPPLAPALANAVHAAIGRRIRSLPLARHDLSWS
jgi:isoquinoline 1-oxidoreductase beta subunit